MVHNHDKCGGGGESDLPPPSSCGKGYEKKI